MKAARSVRRLLVVAALGATAVAAVSAAPAAPVSAACTMCSGGEYHPLDTPVRAYSSPRLSIGTTTSVDLLGLTGTPVLGAGVQRTDVLAVAATVTVTNPLNPGSLKVYATTEPTAALLFFRAGQTVSNWALLTPDADGKVNVKALTAAAVKYGYNVTIDVVGWFSTSSYAGDDTLPGTADDHGLRLHGTDPVRIGSSGAAAVTAAAPLTVPIHDTVNLVTGKPVFGAFPSHTIQAVMLNVTAVKPAVATSLVVQASDAGPATTRSLSVGVNDTVSTLVTARVGADGKVVVTAPTGGARVTVDLVGIFYTGPIDELTKGRVVPLTLPFRVFDTRSAEFGAVPLGPKQAEDWSFAAFANSVKIGGLAVGAQESLIGNLTNATLTRQYPTVPVASGLAVYKPGAALPPANQVSTPEGFTVADSTMFTYGANAVARVYNRAGYAHYLLDVYAVVLS
jgi:hypothetical protein